MGCVASKCNEEAERLRSRAQFLEEELQEARCAREKESRARQHCAALLASREAEWKEDSKRCRDEAAKLRRRLEDQRRKATATADSSKAGGVWEQQQQQLEACFLLEQMRVEQALREEQVDKWKQLYFAIKTELDDLIQQTRQGERFCWRSEADTIGILQRELKAKEEMAESLTRRLAVMEDEGAKRDREIDILRQSLRILSNKKRNSTRQSLPKMLRT